MDNLELKVSYLGYKNGIEKLSLGKKYDPFFKLISGIGLNSIPNLPVISLEEVKKDAVSFYAKYFDVHDVLYASNENLSGISEKVRSGQIDILTAYREYYELVRDVSPFEIPLRLTDGHSMDGNTFKPLMVLADMFIPSEIGKFVPFSEITLGDYLTKLSSSTYVHEIAHTQQESVIGYAESFLNKEVISIFLEKMSALENDPTGMTLLASERRRFMHLSGLIKELNLDGKFVNLSEEERLNNFMYIHSTLAAEKLFDMYLNERKQKNKDKYICDIQDVFDGKQTVEDMLGKRNVTVEKGLDIGLVKRHI